MNCPAGTRLMMTADTVGGVWTFAANLARELGAAGFEVLVVTLGPGASAAQRAMVSGFPGVSLLETELALEWQDPAGADLARALMVLEQVASLFKPQIVHLNGFREASYGWKAPTIVTAHSCVNSWAVACGENDAFTGREWTAYTANVEAGLRQATAWVAPTFTFRDQLRRLYRLKTPGRAIRNGAEPVTGQARYKQPIILGAGRVWDKAKNLTALASIASRLDWPVRIAGASDAQGRAAVGDSAHCKFLGELSHVELRREYGTASVFVSPALYEPFGLSVLEAATAGCALVLSDIPPLRELWDGAAHFFDPREEGAMIGCLRLLISDDAQRATLQRAATERAGRYPLGSTVASYCSLYSELLAGGSAHALTPDGERMIA
jgi:glycosyltransferase involved in cell wall biosynthesis